MVYHHHSMNPTQGQMSDLALGHEVKLGAQHLSGAMPFMLTTQQMRKIMNDVDGLSGSGDASTQAATGGTIPYRNPALTSRISVFAQRSIHTPVAAGFGAIGFTAFIPLKFITSFFEVMNFPMINLNLRITISLSGSGTFNQYSPWTIPTFPTQSAVGTVLGTSSATTITPVGALGIIPSTVVPSVAIGNAVIVARTVDSRNATIVPRLFLKTVYFKSKDAEELKNKILKGFQKTLVYSTATMYPFNGSTATNINQVITQSVIRPTRMFVFPLKQGTLAASDNCFPSSIGPNFLTNTQILLNGNAFYQNEFRTQYSYYREFKTQCIASGSAQSVATPISYSDWLSGVNPYVFDLSRNPTVRSNNACALTLITDVGVSATPTVAIAVPYELVCVVERLMTVTFDVSAGGVLITCKAGADM